MKKLLAAGLVLTMGLSLTACMGGTANSSSAASGGADPVWNGGSPRNWFTKEK